MVFVMMMACVCCVDGVVLDGGVGVGVGGVDDHVHDRPAFRQHFSIWPHILLLLLLLLIIIVIIIIISSSSSTTTTTTTTTTIILLFIILTFRLTALPVCSVLPSRNLSLTPLSPGSR